MPDEMKPTTIPLSAEVERDDLGWTCRFRTECGLRQHQMVATADDRIVLTANVYRDTTGGYDACYLIVGVDGELEAALKEDRGVLPDLFETPEGQLWAAVVDPYGDKDKTLVLPLHGRADVPEPKPMPADIGEPFSGSWFVKRPASRKGNDKVFEITFKKGVAKRGKAIKLEAPSGHVLTRGDEPTRGGLQAVVWVDGKWRHRAFADDGSVRNERDLELDLRESYSPVVPVRLAFETDSVLIVAEGRTMRWVTIAPDGSVRSKDLLTVDEGKSIYNVWKPVRSERGMGLRFNGDGTLGFAWVRDGELVEAFLVDEGTAREVNGDREIAIGDMGFSISGMSATSGGYRVAFSPSERTAGRLVVWGRTFG